MPSTFVALLLLVVVLIPGLCGEFIRERGRGADRGLPDLRETGRFVLLSLSADITVAAVFAAVREIAPRHAPDVSQLVRAPSKYLSDNLGYVLGWSAALVAAASLVAVAQVRLLQALQPQRRLRRVPLVNLLLPPADGAKIMSIWDELFELHPDKYKKVECRLDDGTTISGWLRTYSHQYVDSADREIGLAAPLVIRDPGQQARALDHGTLSVSARRIAYMYVAYVESINDEMASPDVASVVTVPEASGMLRSVIRRMTKR
jgi:hypothetical protein